MLASEEMVAMVRKCVGATQLKGVSRALRLRPKTT